MDKYDYTAPDPADYGVWIPGIPVLVENVLDKVGCAEWLRGLILDGIVAGLGAVLGFVPQILILFIFLAFLEGCGYMAQLRSSWIECSANLVFPVSPLSQC